MVRHSMMRAPLEELERMQRRTSVTQGDVVSQRGSADKIDRKDHYVQFAIIGLLVTVCVLGIVGFLINSNTR